MTSQYKATAGGFALGLGIAGMVSAVACILLPHFIEVADRSLYFRLASYLAFGLGAASLLLGIAGRGSSLARIGTFLGVFLLIGALAYTVLGFGTIIPIDGPLDNTQP